MAGGSVYWITGSNVYSESVPGGSPNLVQSFTPGVVSLSDIAVDAATNSVVLGLSDPGDGPVLASYPLNGGSGRLLAFGGNSIHGVTIVGNVVYWIDGANVLSENLDGTGQTVDQSFFPTVVLSDLGYDAAESKLLVGNNPPQGEIDIAKLGLQQNGPRTTFAFTTAPAEGIKIAGETAYWIEGSNIWSENLDGTNKTLLQTLPDQVTVTDLAVQLDPPTSPAPEPASALLLGGGVVLIAVFTLRRQIQ